MFNSGGCWAFQLYEVCMHVLRMVARRVNFLVSSKMFFMVI